MILFGLEIPTVTLGRWTPLTDLDFVLAHKVLQDPSYARFFKDRHSTREVILDNSTHEFGIPLSIEQLVKARSLIDANYLIAPDIVRKDAPPEQYSKNLEWLDATCDNVEPSKVGFVLCGRTRQQRLDALLEASKWNVGMLCLSFHIPERLEWWEELEEAIVDNFSRIHLLGMTNVAEIKEWVRISNTWSRDITFSLDTCKPLKLGVQKQLFATQADKNLRGGPINSKSILEMNSFDRDQIVCVEENINFLRKVCAGASAYEYRPS